eukprot:scaffold926_cov248-Pinguiococcus_pyrenoidosus.AAC.31
MGKAKRKKNQWSHTAFELAVSAGGGGGEAPVAPAKRRDTMERQDKRRREKRKREAAQESAARRERLGQSNKAERKASWKRLRASAKGKALGPGGQLPGKKTAKKLKTQAGEGKQLEQDDEEDGDGGEELVVDAEPAWEDKDAFSELLSSLQGGPGDVPGNKHRSM